MSTLLTQYKLMQSQRVTLIEQLTELAKVMTDYEYLNSVPGISDCCCFAMFALRFRTKNICRPKHKADSERNYAEV